MRCPSRHVRLRLVIAPALWVALLAIGPRSASAGCHVADRPSIAFSVAERGRIAGETLGAIATERLALAQVSPAPCDPTHPGSIGHGSTRMVAWSGLGVRPDPPAAAGPVWLPIRRLPSTRLDAGPERPPRR